MFGAFVAAVVIVVADGHVERVVGDPLRLWSRWASGEKVDDARLWGWPMLAWGRTGKLLQFAAGLAVILDLIEPKRLRKFGTRLRDQSWRQLADRLEQPVMLAGALFIAALIAVPVVDAVIDLPHTVLRVWQIASLGIIPVSVSLGFLFVKVLKRAQTEEGVSSLARYWPFFVVGGVPMLVWLAITRGFLIPLANGLAWALVRNRPGHPLRWAALVLFVTGFGLDLLAS
ncbi:hypothetical protein [Lentzea sp. NBRC 102530]|uniref:hypothetical protein n=1 Tax=Lentzea sp. NBRC 102530 TaxID=3032201 RepID=UPI00255230C1|nr:hypothetical protein [Lentzea sp. NBRC 102530]